MSVASLIDQFPLLAAAPEGVKRLRELILELAVSGKLMPQDPSDEPASELLKRIRAKRAKLVAEGEIKKDKPLPEIDEDDKPFELPVGWEWSLFGQIAEIERGGSPRPIKSYLTNDPDGLNWIKIGDTDKGGKYITAAEEKIRREGLHKTRMVYPGDFLLTNSMSFGRPYITQIEGCIHDGWLRIAPPIELDKDYLYSLLSSPFIRKLFVNAAAGAVVMNLNAEKVRYLPIPLPPLAEQHRIVAKVDELMALCDRLEAQQADAASAHATLVRTVLDTLTQSQSAADFAANWQRIAQHFDTLFTTEASIDALKQTVLQLAVMGKLVPQDPSDEPVSELLKRIQAEKAKLVAEGKIKKDKPLPEIGEDEKPFELPEGWEWSRLGTLCAKITDGEHATPRRSSFGHFLLSARNVTNEGIVLSDVDFVPTDEFEKIRKRCDPNIGDVLISCSGSVGRVALVDRDNAYSMVRSAAMVRPIPSGITPFFTAKCLRSPTVQAEMVSKSRQSAQANLFLGSISSLTIPVPPLEEQHRIVSKVDELMALCDQLRARLKAARELAAHYATAAAEAALEAA